MNNNRINVFKSFYMKEYSKIYARHMNYINRYSLTKYEKDNLKRYYSEIIKLKNEDSIYSEKYIKFLNMLEEMKSHFEIKTILIKKYLVCVDKEKARRIIMKIHQELIYGEVDSYLNKNMELDHYSSFSLRR